ncbi:MAG: UvrD-helicase domain-containing protein [Pseudomonadota bacterium]
MTKPIVPSDEQDNIVEASLLDLSFSVDASAGTGKSTVLGMVVAANPDKRFLYIVFNRANALEAKKKFKHYNNVVVSTANGLGFRSIMMGQNWKEIIKNDVSIYTYAHHGNAMKYGSFQGVDRMKYFLQIKDTITNFCRSNDQIIDIKHVPANPAFMDHYDEIIHSAKNYWYVASNFKCEFNHDFYMKMWSLQNPSLNYDYILYDEAQDTDPIMLEIVNKQYSNKIIVGDKYQQIYAFRGSVNAMDKFEVSGKLRLSQSYRYGQEIANIANKIVNHHHAYDPDIKGTDLYQTKIIQSSSSFDNNSPEVIICRTNTQIITEMIEAKELGIKFYAYLETLEVKKIIRSIFSLKNAGEKKPIVYHDLLKDFDSYSEMQDFLSAGGSPALSTFLNLYYKYGYADINNAIKEVEKNKKIATQKIHSHEHNGIEKIFISAHKSKGLEFDNVKIGSDFNEKGSKKYDAEEGNLVYVVSTRAQKTLNIGDSKELINLHG